MYSFKLVYHEKKSLKKVKYALLFENALHLVCFILSEMTENKTSLKFIRYSLCVILFDVSIGIA